MKLQNVVCVCVCVCVHGMRQARPCKTSRVVKESGAATSVPAVVHFCLRGRCIELQAGPLVMCVAWHNAGKRLKKLIRLMEGPRVRVPSHSHACIPPGSSQHTQAPSPREHCRPCLATAPQLTFCACSQAIARVKMFKIVSMTAVGVMCVTHLVSAHNS